MIPRLGLGKCVPDQSEISTPIRNEPIAVNIAPEEPDPYIQEVDTMPVEELKRQLVSARSSLLHWEKHYSEAVGHFHSRMVQALAPIDAHVSKCECCYNALAVAPSSDLFAHATPSVSAIDHPKKNERGTQSDITSYDMHLILNSRSGNCVHSTPTMSRYTNRLGSGTIRSGYGSSASVTSRDSSKRSTLGTRTPVKTNGSTPRTGNLSSPFRISSTIGAVIAGGYPNRIASPSARAPLAVRGNHVGAVAALALSDGESNTLSRPASSTSTSSRGAAPGRQIKTTSPSGSVGAASNSSKIRRYIYPSTSTVNSARAPAMAGPTTAGPRVTRPASRTMEMLRSRLLPGSNPRGGSHTIGYTDPEPFAHR